MAKVNYNGLQEGFVYTLYKTPKEGQSYIYKSSNREYFYIFTDDNGQIHNIEENKLNMLFY